MDVNQTPLKNCIDMALDKSPGRMCGGYSAFSGEGNTLGNISGLNILRKFSRI